MKFVLLIFTFNAFALFTNAQTNHIPDSTKQVLIVEASCGQCQFNLSGKGCNLAIRLNGKAYFVDGANIDAYGDAHAKDGFCESIQIANVQGEIINNRFNVSFFELQKNKLK